MSEPNIDPSVLELITKITKEKVEASNESKPTGPETTFREFVNDSNYVAFQDLFKIKTTGKINLDLPVFKPDDWHPDIRARIPVADDAYHFDPEVTAKIALAMKVGGPIMLYGPTGTGKTSIIKQIAARLGIPFLRVGCHKQQEASEFLGTTQVVNDNGVPVTQHNHTDTTLAAQHGGILVVDEAFRSPILMAIQSLLEMPPTLALQDCQGAQSVLNPPKGRFWIFLTDNTNGTGDSSGSYIAEAQDLSTITRIRSTVYMDYMKKKEEKEMVKKSFPNLNDKDIDGFVAVANLIRDAFKVNKMMQTMDIRALMAWAENYSYVKDYNYAFNLCFGFKLSDTDYAIASNAYRQVFGKNLSRK